MRVRGTAPPCPGGGCMWPPSSATQHRLQPLRRAASARDPALCQADLEVQSDGALRKRLRKPLRRAQPARVCVRRAGGDLPKPRPAGTPAAPGPRHAGAAPIQARASQLARVRRLGAHLVAAAERGRAGRLRVGCWGRAGRRPSVAFRLQIGSRGRASRRRAPLRDDATWSATGGAVPATRRGPDRAVEPSRTCASGPGKKCGDTSPN